MSKITDQVGAALRKRLEDCLLKPLNWRMIDVLSTMDEKEGELRTPDGGDDDGRLPIMDPNKN